MNSLRASALTIVHLVPALDGGGVETDVVGLSAALVRAGHRSIVISGGGRLVEKIEADGGEHLTWPVGKKSPASLLLVPRLRALLRARQVDILHAHSRVPAWLGFLAWRGMKVARAPRPCVCHTHSPTGGAPVPRPRFVTTMHGLNTPGWFSAVMLRGEKVIAVSNTVKNFVAKNYPGADLSKIEVIERGVNPTDFPFGFKPDAAWRAAWQAQFPELAGRFVFTLAGRLTRLKGHLEALEALAQLRLAKVDAHLLVVGGEDPRRAGYAAELRAAVAAKGLADRVTFTGHRSDIREVLAISSAVVSCSTKPETFGLSVLEAIRLGVPVVGYDHGGVGEVLAKVYPQGRVPFAPTAEARAKALAETLAAMAKGEVAPPAPGDDYPLARTQAQTMALYARMGSPSWPLPRRSFGRFGLMALMAAFVALSAVAALNILVDPWNNWRTPTGRALMPYKKLGYDPAEKTGHFSTGSWPVVFVGASRTELGLDPSAPALAGQPAYNFGMSAVSFPTIMMLADYALDHDPALATLVVEVDPNYLRAEGLDSIAASPLNPGHDKIALGFKRLFGSQATYQSLRTLQCAFKGKRVECVRGMRHYNEHERTPHQLFAMRQWGVPGFDWRPEGAAVPKLEELTAVKPRGLELARMDALLPLARQCRLRGVRLVVFVPPCHAVRLAAYAKGGHWPQIKAFKRRLAELGKEGGFEVRDCMGCGPWATEDIPAAPGSRMRWYHEPIHFRKELGDQVLAGIFGKGGIPPGGMGVALTQGSIEAHLAKVDDDLCAYVKTHPGLMGLLPTEGVVEQVRTSAR